MAIHSSTSYHPLATSALCLEALLDRAPADFDAKSLNGYLNGRTVLLTGAGGSIGRVLAQKLVHLKPKKIILADFSEFNLFHLEHSLNKLKPSVECVFQLIDIRDIPAVQALLSEHKPQVVFHAAAYKHVPMMEHHPIAAFQNNTQASVNLLHLAERSEVNQFVFISTDKAVAPSSVMGTTKRLTEWYVRAANGNMKTKTVRFGNVFGSLGSVVPMFIEQIRDGGPVTVTHPDMERFFMSVDDACCLILQTLLFELAPVYTLRMDPAVKILWLAEKMIDVLSPDKNVDIEFSGIRAGEKIKEQLWATFETPLPTPNRDILGLKSSAHYSRTELDERLTYLTSLASARESDLLRDALFEINFIAEMPRL